MTSWVLDRIAQTALSVPCLGRLGDLRLGVHWIGSAQNNPTLACALAQLTLGIVSAGGSVVSPSNASHLASDAFMQDIVGTPNADDGQNPTTPQSDFVSV